MYIVQSNYPQRTVYIVGDSLLDYGNGITVHAMEMGLKAYVDILAAGKKCAFQCYAIGGQTTTTMISNFNTVLGPLLRPNDIVVHAGVGNDLGSVTPAQAYANYQTYAGLIRAKGAIAISMSSIANNNATAETNKATFEGLVTADPSFCNAYFNCRVTHFAVQADSLDMTYYYTDNTHLTTLGYQTLGALMATYIIPFL